MEIVKIDLVPSGVMPSCHASQYDIGREIRFLLTDGGEEYTLAGTETISIELRKPDGTSETIAIENTFSNYVDWVTSDGELDLSGVYLAEISIKNGDDVLGSANFIVKTEADAYDGAGVRTVTVGPADICTFETTLPEPYQSVTVNVVATQDLHGEDKPYPAGGGVNLFDKNNTFEGYIVDTTGNFSPRTGDVATDFISVVGGASYYVKSEQEQGMWGAWYNENKEYISACTGYANRAITAPTDAKFVRLTVVHNSGNTDTFGFNYPATDHDYHPYENICPINGYTEANITRCGVNIWNEEWELGNINSSGEPTASTTSIRAKNYIPCTPNTNYYQGISGGSSSNIVTYFYDVNKTFIPYTGTGAYNNGANPSNGLFTSPENAVFMRFRVGSAYGTTYNNDISINYPATDTTYHSYNGQTYTIAFGQTVYGGVLDVTRGKLHVTHAITDLGLLSWNKDYYSSTLKYYYYASSISGALGYSGWTEVGNIKCDSYPTVSRRDVLTGNLGITLSANVNGGVPNIYNPDFDNVETTENDVKTAMSGVMLAYELATPFDIDLTPQVISAVVGTNNVFADCGQTTVKFLKAGA